MVNGKIGACVSLSPASLHCCYFLNLNSTLERGNLGVTFFANKCGVGPYLGQGSF